MVVDSGGTSGGELEGRFEEFAQRAERENVGDAVCHFDPTGVELLKVMLMVPDAVRADALFIHEESPRLDVCDLREPAHGDAEQRTHAVFDHHAGMNALRQRGEDGEVQFGRCDLGEVARVGKEIPCALHAGAEDLRGVENVDHGAGESASGKPGDDVLRQPVSRLCPTGQPSRSWRRGFRFVHGADQSRGVPR